MKCKLMLIMLLGLSSLTYAQKKDPNVKNFFTPGKRHFLMEVRGGASFDLFDRNDHADAWLIHDKKKTTFTTDLRFTYLFSRKWGWYGDLNFNHYSEKRPEGVEGSLENLFEDLVKFLFFGKGYIHTSLSAGMLYRVEKGKWGLYPQVGIGKMRYLEDRSTEKTRTKNEEKVTVKYRQKAAPLFVEAGFSANYYVARHFYLTLHAAYQQPIQKSYAEISYSRNDVAGEKTRYSSNSIGRNIKLSGGVGMVF